MTCWRLHCVHSLIDPNHCGRTPLMSPHRLHSLNHPTKSSCHPLPAHTRSPLWHLQCYSYRKRAVLIKFSCQISWISFSLINFFKLILEVKTLENCDNSMLLIISIRQTSSSAFRKQPKHLHHQSYHRKQCPKCHCTKPPDDHSCCQVLQLTSLQFQELAQLQYISRQFNFIKEKEELVQVIGMHQIRNKLKLIAEHLPTLQDTDTASCSQKASPHGSCRHWSNRSSEPLHRTPSSHFTPSPSPNRFMSYVAAPLF